MLAIEEYTGGFVNLTTKESAEFTAFVGRYKNPENGRKRKNIEKVYIFEII